jgi:hypothetical protein
VCIEYWETSGNAEGGVRCVDGHTVVVEHLHEFEVMLVKPAVTKVAARGMSPAENHLNN